jgi:hypothetical protein
MADRIDTKAVMETMRLAITGMEARDENLGIIERVDLAEWREALAQEIADREADHSSLETVTLWLKSFLSAAEPDGLAIIPRAGIEEWVDFLAVREKTVRAVGPRGQTIDVLLSATQTAGQEETVARRGCRAALWLIGNDADRARIGKKPWGENGAGSVVGILRAALDDPPTEVIE